MNKKVLKFVLEVAKYIISGLIGFLGGSSVAF